MRSEGAIRCPRDEGPAAVALTRDGVVVDVLLPDPAVVDREA